LAAWVCAALAGCGTHFSNLEKNATLTPTSREGVVVMAVDPPVRLTLVRGESEGGTWTTQGGWAAATVWPEQGFVVLKLEPRVGPRGYAIEKVLPVGIGGPIYMANTGNAVAVFEAPAGQVTYVGALAMGQEGKSIFAWQDPSVTLESVERFMQVAYPNLPRPVPRKLEMKRVSGALSPPWTPRDGVLSGVWFGVGFGPAALKRAVAARAAVGSGTDFRLTLGAALWDHLSLAFSGGRMHLTDPQPSSSAWSGGLFNLETGLQHRFRPSRSWSLLPFAFVGHLWNVGSFVRRNECDDCKDVPIPGVSANGVYAGPGFKVTFAGWLGIALRSDLFLSGDLSHRTIATVEFGAP
jgi:hypothetical protein